MHRLTILPPIATRNPFHEHFLNPSPPLAILQIQKTRMAGETGGTDVTTYVTDTSSAEWQACPGSPGTPTDNCTVLLGLEPGIDYQLTVSSYNGAPRASSTGDGASCSTINQDGWAVASAAITEQTLAVPPEAPTDVMAACEFSSCNPLGDVARSGTQIIISWRAPFKAGSDITEYKVYTNATSEASKTASVSEQIGSPSAFHP